MHIQCGNCRFWDRHIASHELGDCCRHAPRPSIVVADQQRLEVAFPEMHTEAFCGEFQPRPAPQQRGEPEERLRGLLREFLNAARQDEITGWRLALLVEKVEETLQQ